MTLTATIVSCVQREATRAETSRQLQALGLIPYLALSPCDPTANRATARAPGSRGNAAAAADALRTARAAEGACLYCEDDITLASDFAHFLSMATNQNAVTYLCFLETEGTMSKHYGPETTRSIMRGEPQHRRLHPLLWPRSVLGSQCVYLPPAFLKRAEIDKLAGSGLPGDIFIATQAAKLGIPAMVALPNPVQHRHVRKLRHPDRHPKRSLSYHLQRREG